MRGTHRSLVDEIYEAAVIPERWPQVLERISALSGSLGGFMIATTPESEFWIASERTRQHFEDWFSSGWQDQNIWAEKILLHRPTGFFDESDIFSPGEMDTIPMYREFILPRGFGWSATAHLEMPTGNQVDFRFDRRFQDGPVESIQKMRLNRLKPHLARAAFLFTCLGRWQARSAVDALQSIDLPAAVLSRGGKLLAWNAAMETRLSQVSVGVGERLVLSDEGAQTAVSEGLTKIGAGLFGQMSGPIRIPATEEHAESVAYLVPMRVAAQDIFGGGSTILIIRPAEPKNRVLDLVRMRFAIDAQEAQRITRLICGSYPRLAAALLTSSAAIDVTWDRLLGATRTRQEAKLASFLSRIATDGTSFPTDQGLSFMAQAS